MLATLKTLMCVLLMAAFAVPVQATNLTATARLSAQNSSSVRDTAVDSAARPWQQQAELIASDGKPADHFAGAVAIRGDTILVGAWGKNSNRGAVYVFVQRGARWTQQAKIAAGDGAAGDHFGSAIALVGDTALVGAPGTAGYTGAVYVFVRSGGRWIQQAKLTAHDATGKDWFGRAVALGGDTALVGAWYQNSGAGAAYVFERHGTRWAEEARLSATNGQTEDYFGTSVAISGGIALVGAGFQHGETGAVYVFMREGTRWIQRAQVTASDGVSGDIFGSFVALNGDTALIGAAGKASYTGAAYIFVRTATRWAQTAKLMAGDAAPKDWFGRSAALSGDTALVGAWYQGKGAGAAYVFERQGSHWMQRVKLTAQDGSPEDCFGGAVALSGGTALVGAGFRNAATGAAYVFIQNGE